MLSACVLVAGSAGAAPPSSATAPAVPAASAVLAADASAVQADPAAPGGPTLSGDPSTSSTVPAPGAATPSGRTDRAEDDSSGGTAAAPTSARAVPALGVVVRPAGSGDVRLGPYPGPAGSEEHGYCVQARVAPTRPGDVPESIGVVVDPLLAAAMATHRWSTDDLTQAALALTAHERHERPGILAGGDPAAAAAAVRAATPAAVLDRQAEILAQAADLAGPFTADAGTIDASERRIGSVRGMALRSATGVPVPGKPFTVTLDGPAVLDVTGTRTYEGTTGPAPIDLTWTATGSGQVTVHVRFTDVTRTTLTVYDMTGNRQDQVTYGDRPTSDEASVTTTTPPFEVAKDFQPVAVSDVGDAKVVDAGQPISDTLTVSAAPGETWLRLDGRPVPVVLEGTAYGTGSVPAPQRPDVPAGAPVVARASVTAAGPGVYPVSVPGPATGQVVTWVWRVVKADQAPEVRDLIRADWSDAFGIAQETTSVRWTTGTVDTALSIRVTRGGTYLVDDLMVTGLPEDHPDFTGGHGLRPDVTHLGQELWFFPEGTPVDDDHLDAARLLGSVEVPARNGFHPSVSDPSFRVQEVDGRPEPGTYVFRTVFAGDDRVAAFASTVTDVTEQHLVPADEAPIGVSTRAQADRDLVAGRPAVLHDVAVVTGTVPAGATLEFALHRWDGDSPECSEVTLVDRSAAVPLPGAGEHLSPATRIDALGTGRYGYVETVRAADGRVLHRGECGLAAETLTVSAPPQAPAPPTPVPPTRSGVLAMTGTPAVAVAGTAVLALAAGLLVAAGARRRRSLLPRSAGTGTSAGTGQSDQALLDVPDPEGAGSVDGQVQAFGPVRTVGSDEARAGCPDDVRIGDDEVTGRAADGSGRGEVITP